MKITAIKNYNIHTYSHPNINNNQYSSNHKKQWEFPSHANIINFTSNIKNIGLPAKNYDLNNKTILITGATGTLGNALIKELLENYSPKQIIVFSRDEYKQYKMKQKLPKNAPIKFVIGDVRDNTAIKKVMKTADVVIHTAAMKHVSICEENKEEALKTNFYGTINLVNATLNSNAKRFILISTDKAANPENFYGRSKKLAEGIVNNAAQKTNENQLFSIIRMGNILGSRGSVLPLFNEQKETGELTVTNEEMTRFFISPKQAAKQVLSSIEIMRGGETFIPKLKSAKIIDLAKQTAPECKIKIIGALAEEKIHEDLISRDEISKTFELQDRYVILPKKNHYNVPKLVNNSEISSNDKNASFTKEELSALIKECLS